MLKTCCRVSLVLMVVLLGYMNCKLYYQPAFIEVEQHNINQDVYEQLQFLEQRLRLGEGQKMQTIFPEEFLFINALYGLAWCDFLNGVSDTTNLFQEGLAQINWAFGEINSPEGRQIFNQNLPLEYGAFYQGWSTYLLARKLSLQPTSIQNSAEIALFKKKCARISKALLESGLPFLESYQQQVWPADMMPCILSLKIHDQLFETQYNGQIQDWIKQVKQTLDPTTGLIPHAVDYYSGKPLEGARGSSQSLILNFLIDIDEDFSREQYQRYQAKFLDRRFGLPGIREYPKGKEGKGDIDSGPVILAIGGAASIVGQRTAGQYQDWSIYTGLRNSIETFGCPYDSINGKKYIFGELPMADAFIAWSNAIEHSTGVNKPIPNWRWRFQLLSIALMTLISFIIWKI